jgi:hypothetical protein
MTKNEIKACRAAEVRTLAERGADNPASLYNRLVRYACRFKRYGEASNDRKTFETEWRREAHAHEFALLAAFEKRLGSELDALGLEFEYPGLWPLVIDKESHEHVLWLYRY